MEAKYTNGAKVTSVTMLEKHIGKNDFFRFRDKTVARGVLLNLTYRQVRNAIDRGEICLAKTVGKK